jgi:hypothetical protein
VTVYFNMPEELAGREDKAKNKYGMSLSGLAREALKPAPRTATARAAGCPMTHHSLQRDI